MTIQEIKFADNQVEKIDWDKRKTSVSLVTFESGKMLVLIWRDKKKNYKNLFNEKIKTIEQLEAYDCWGI